MKVGDVVEIIECSHNDVPSGTKGTIVSIYDGDADGLPRGVGVEVDGTWNRGKDKYVGKEVVFVEEGKYKT